MEYKNAFPFRIENNILIGKEEPIDNTCSNIGELILSRFKSKPDFVGQVDAATKEQNTFQQMRERSVKCALWLKKQNVKQGDIVVICTHNHLNAYVPLLGCIYIGAIANPWPEQIGKSTARYLFQQVMPKIIFANDSTAATFFEIATELNVPTKIIVFGKAEGFESFESILNEYRDESEIDGFSCTNLKTPRDTSIILFSSGSTGFPKGVEICHALLKAPLNQQTVDILPDDSVLWFGSLNWITGVSMTIFTILACAKAVKSLPVNPEEVCRIVEQYKVTVTLFETSLCTRLLKSNALGMYNVSSLRRIIYAGSAMPVETWKALVNLLPSTAITGVYGTTETSVMVTQLSNGKVGSSGYVLKNTRLLVADTETGKPLGPNKPGEIWCTSPFLMNGYYQNPELTMDIIDKNGWLHTGDLGYYDEDGIIFVISRIKELIKYRGHHVPTGEIENLLHSHPAVAEAVVTAVQHDVDLEHPIAFIVKVPGAEVTEVELEQLVADNLEDIKRLRGGVVFINELPHVPNGKVDKKKLRDMAKAYAKQ